MTSEVGMHSKRRIHMPNNGAARIRIECKNVIGRSFEKTHHPLEFAPIVLRRRLDSGSQKSNRWLNVLSCTLAHKQTFGNKSMKLFGLLFSKLVTFRIDFK